VLSNQARERSRLWYVLPVVLSIIGGLIAFFILRHDDPEKAKNCLWLGIILFASYLAYYVLFSFMTEFFEFSEGFL